jgi:predicted ester cyclase
MSTQTQTQTDLMKRTLRRMLDEVLNLSNLDALVDFYDADMLWHGPGGKEIVGLEELKEMIGGYLAAFPDLRMSVTRQVAEGDLLCTHWLMLGTNDGALGEIPATGKSIEMEGIAISRFEGSKIVEEWEHFDELGMLQQIGVVES